MSPGQMKIEIHLQCDIHPPPPYYHHHFNLESFSIQKFILQILDLYKGPFLDVFGKKLQYNFLKMRGGVEAVWYFSENSTDLVA